MSALEFVSASYTSETGSLIKFVLPNNNKKKKSSFFILQVPDEQVLCIPDPNRDDADGFILRTIIANNNNRAVAAATAATNARNTTTSFEVYYRHAVGTIVVNFDDDFIFKEFDPSIPERTNITTRDGFKLVAEVQLVEHDDENEEQQQQSNNDDQMIHFINDNKDDDKMLNSDDLLLVTFVNPKNNNYHATPQITDTLPSLHTLPKTSPTPKALALYREAQDAEMSYRHHSCLRSNLDENKNNSAARAVDAGSTSSTTKIKKKAVNFWEDRIAPFFTSSPPPATHAASNNDNNVFDRQQQQKQYLKSSLPLVFSGGKCITLPDDSAIRNAKLSTDSDDE